MKVSLILYYWLGKHEKALEVIIDVEKFHKLVNVYVDLVVFMRIAGAS